MVEISEKRSNDDDVVGRSSSASHFHARELTSHATETLSTLVSRVVLRAPSPPSRRDSEPDARARRERVGRQP